MYPNNFILLCAQTIPILYDGAVKEFEKYFQQYNIKYDLTKSGSEPKFHLHDCNSIIRLGTLEKDVDRLRSPEWGAIFIDEAAQVNKEVWDTISVRARNRGSGRVRVFTNSKDLGPGHWMYEEFKKNPTPQNPTLDYLTGHKFLTVSTYDNFYNRESTIVDLEQKYQPGSEDHAQWILGHIVYGRKTAIPEWGKYSDELIVHPSQVPDLEAYAYGLDFGEVHPTCMLEGGLDSSGKLWITNEYHKPDTPRDVHNLAIAEMYKPGCHVFADHNPEWQNDLRSLGVRVMNMYKADVGLGVSLIRKRVRLKDIRVSTNCPNLIDDLYKYEKDTLPGGKEVFGHGPNHKYSHSVDALRGLICGIDMHI